MTVIKRISLADRPRKVVERRSSVEKMPQWAKLQANINEGIPENDGILFHITAEDAIKYRVTKPLTVTRFLKNYVDDLKKGYTVSWVTDKDGNGHTYTVEHWPHARSKRG